MARISIGKRGKSKNNRLRAKKFNIKAGCIINKSDLNQEKSDEIIEYLNNEDIIHICNLPYDENFTKAMTVGKTIIEYNENNIKPILEQSWENIKQITMMKDN